jgi:3-(3-hydroxy-phenyl)propionate hydroxylase
MSTRICVVGAGPVGVVAALSCARYGMHVTLLEASREVDRQPRASTTHPSTLEILAKLGLLEEFQSVGLIARYFQFWDSPHRLVAQFDHEVLRGETQYPHVVQTEQHKLCEIALRRLAHTPEAEVRVGTSLVCIEQDAGEVRVQVEGPTGMERLAFDYVIACDGARSAVRKCLNIAFEGYTWPERFMVLTTRFDFAAALGCCHRSYISDSHGWANLFKVAGDDLAGRWRVVMPIGADQNENDALSDSAVSTRLHRWFPRHPIDMLTHRNMYRVHQRVARSFRDGRVFLAGDAAHVNNPIGGLGFNCGIHDAVELSDTLRLVTRGEAGEGLFDRYAQRRRALNIEYVQQQTVDNKRRLDECDPRTREANLEHLRRTAENPVLHKQFLMRTSLLESTRKSAAMVELARP